MPNYQDVIAATQEMIRIANDPQYGYNQKNRYGPPDFDCSSLVAYCFHNAGFTDIPYTAYTGNLARYLELAGFTNVKSLVNVNTGAGLQYGDILLTVTKHHTAVYIGNDQLVEAVHDENRSKGGSNTIPGDQTGDEIRIHAFYKYTWEYVARWTDGQGGGWHGDTPGPTPEQSQTFVIKLPTLRRGAKYGVIGVIQAILQYKYRISVGRSGIDGDFGANTENAVKTFQKQKGLTVDGIIGPKTWNKLLEVDKWN